MADSPDLRSIGTQAGLVWSYLHERGKTSIIKLKSELAISATETYLALGWLAREGKVKFIPEDGCISVLLLPEQEEK